MKRVMLKMLKRQLSLGLHGWSVWMDILHGRDSEFEKQRQTMKSVMLKMLKRQLSCGWIHFSRIVRAERRREMAEAEAKKEAKRRAERCKQVIKRLMHNRQFAALQGWSKVVREEKMMEIRRRNKMRSVALKMLKSYQTMAWNSYANAIARIKKEEAVLAAKRRQMKRVMLMMLQRQLSLGWQAWNAYIRAHLAAEMEAQRQKQVMRSVMLKMMKRQLSCGWTAWHGVIDAIKRQLAQEELGREREAAKRRRALERMNSSLRRMQTRGLAIGWNSWAQTTRALRAAEQ